MASWEILTCPECEGSGGTVTGPDEFGNYDPHNDCERCEGDGIVLEEDAA